MPVIPHNLCSTRGCLSEEVVYLYSAEDRLVFFGTVVFEIAVHLAFCLVRWLKCLCLLDQNNEFWL